MVDRARREIVTNRETGMPGPDHHCGYANHWVQLTLTETLVGLVITSKTAERFCD